jgi:hypothetical protein
MNEQRRDLLKMLPLAAVAGAAVKIGATEAQAVEIKPDRRYILKLNEFTTQQDAEAIKATLVRSGFPDMLVVAGDLELYELK